ncbi:hypothetical protein [Undibacterium parvum]|uniref:Exo-alpha-sialidase n=1 Tax=Undibacterium parvum TaxID=401471 RepID=A0A3S9HKA3_9BURK|nr:hypothetical protein [Undibacterium parvum]AZP12525.1 hypothetical protein EJN92_11220 [Undibacterium parvum]
MKTYLSNLARLTGCMAIAGLMLTTLPALAHHNAPAVADKAAAPYSGSAFAPDGALWSVQLNAQGHLALHISGDNGRSWLPERVLDTGDDHIKTSGESPPKIAFGPNGIVIIIYAQPLAKKFTGEIRMLRSTDGGAHFAAPVTLHQDRQVISHSYAVIAFDAKGALHTVWIDSRDKAAVTNANEAAEKTGLAKTDYRGVSLYRNVSFDGGASFGPDTKLSDYSCECCRIAFAPTANGQIAALWRHLTLPNIRDHAFTILSTETPAATATPLAEPVRASYDNWAIDGCPHHGPALTTSAAGGYHAVWFGDRAGVAQVRYGKLDQAGNPVGAVQVLPDAKAEHADILSSGSKLAIVWRSYDGTKMNLKAWISDDDGQHFKLSEIASSKLESDYPQLLSKGGKIYVIWNTTGKRHVEIL